MQGYVLPLACLAVHSDCHEQTSGEVSFTPMRRGTDDNFTMASVPRLEASNSRDGFMGRSTHPGPNLAPPDPPVALSHPSGNSVPNALALPPGRVPVPAGPTHGQVSPLSSRQMIRLTFKHAGMIALHAAVSDVDRSMSLSSEAAIFSGSHVLTCISFVLGCSTIWLQCKHLMLNSIKVRNQDST